MRSTKRFYWHQHTLARPSLIPLIWPLVRRHARRLIWIPHPFCPRARNERAVLGVKRLTGGISRMPRRSCVISILVDIRVRVLLTLVAARLGCLLVDLVDRVLQHVKSGPLMPSWLLGCRLRSWSATLLCFLPVRPMPLAFRGIGTTADAGCIGEQARAGRRHALGCWACLHPVRTGVRPCPTGGTAWCTFLRSGQLFAQASPRL